MSWIKLSDDWGIHPKFTDPETGALCQLLHARSLCYAGRYLTDGFIPASVVSTLLSGFEGLGLINGMTGKDALELNWPDTMISSGLWEPAEGGYQIHDYLIYNPSKKKVETARKLQAQGGRHSQEIQRLQSYPQGQPQGSAKVGLQLSPVPVPEKKEKKLLINPRSRPPVLASPVLKSEDRTTKGFEALSPGMAEIFKELAQEPESDLIVQPEHGN